MYERKLPPLGYQCCDPRGGYEGCCGLFVKTKNDPPKPTPCGQCAHLSKAVESLERYVRIEQETADKMALRGLRAEGKLASIWAYVNQLRGDYKAGNEFSDGAIWAIGEVCSFLNKLDAQTSAQVTRTDLVVADGVTAGETALAAYKRARTAWYEMPVRDDNADDVLQMHTAMEEALDELIASARRGEIGGWVQDPNVMTHAVCRHGVTKGDHCPDCEAMKVEEDAYGGGSNCAVCGGVDCKGKHV